MGVPNPRICTKCKEFFSPRSSGNRLCSTCAEKRNHAAKTRTIAGISRRRFYLLAIKHVEALLKKFDVNKACCICGYDKAVDIAHIKAVKDFPDDAPIKEINDPSNLALLCKNHHWEMDHGLLDPAAEVLNIAGFITVK